MAQPAAELNLWKPQLSVVPDSVWAAADLETLILADNSALPASRPAAAWSTADPLARPR